MNAIPNPTVTPGTPAPPRTAPRAPARLGRALGRALLAALACTGLAAPAAHAAGLMTPASGGAALVLEEQHVEVTIENGFTVTGVEQRFSNPHARDLDALYSFPVPPGAAVGEFTYWIDERPVHAEVLERTEARALHEREKNQGRETALVEAHENDRFEMSVSPVRADSDVRVKLVYLQRSAVDHSVGRYVYPLENGGTDEAADSFWARDESVASAFSFRLKLRSGYPVDAVRVPNGQARVTQLDDGDWEVVVEATSGNGDAVGGGLDARRMAEADVAADEAIAEEAGRASSTELPWMNAGANAAPARSAASPSAALAGSRAPGVYELDHDIVVYWRLAEDLPGSVDLVTHKEAGASLGTFMLTLTPGIDLAPITEGRDWIFVLDTSGSMSGKFFALSEGVRAALGRLNPNDRFEIVRFDDRAKSLTGGLVPADAGTVARAIRTVGRLAAGGSTNLFDGLKVAAKSIDRDRTSAIVLVTDGVANVGPTKLTRFVKLLEPYDVRLFTAVMGNNANTTLLEGLTRYSDGFAVAVSNDDDITGLLMQATSKVSHESLHDVEVSIDGVRTSDLVPGRFTRVYRGEQLVLMGRYAGGGEARVRLDARVSGQKVRYESRAGFPIEALENPELERLHAFASIQALEAEEELVGATDDSRRAILDLALGAGLVTDQTSLVVVRDEVFAAEGIERRNAARVEAEHVARAARASAPTVSHRQDTDVAAFPDRRATVSNGRASSGSGGGAFGTWTLMLLGLLAAIRVGLGLSDRVRGR